MSNKLFPTPESIPFDVEEVHEAISKYKGYPSTKIINRHSPRLVKELKKCGWGIDDKGYIYPINKFGINFRLNFSLWDQRAKSTLSGSIIIALLFSFLSMVFGCSFVGSFKALLPIFWLASYCLTYSIDASEGRL